jgi:uncharacterized integral membrane protein
MTKSLALLIILSALPSYFALFCDSTPATIILCVSTIIGFVITGVSSESEIPMERSKLGWLIHIVGIMVVVFVKNVIQ